MTRLATLLLAAVSLCATAAVSLAQTSAPSSPTKPAARLEDMPADSKLPTLWIIGDSTVKNGTRGQVGWGDPIKDLFDSSKVNVVNRAIGGRSSRTFRTDGRWDAILQIAKPGDFVLMQFGHNDPSALAGDNRERGTIRGVGDESQEVTLTLGANKDKKEVVHSYGWYMRQYCKEAKAHGMQATVCSYVPRAPRRANDKRGPTSSAAPIESAGATPPMTSYQLWAKQSAEAEGATFVDLMSIINARYAKETPDAVKQKYFTEADDTHQSPEGARLNAECVVEGLRQVKSPLVEYLK